MVLWMGGRELWRGTEILESVVEELAVVGELATTLQSAAFVIAG